MTLAAVAQEASRHAAVCSQVPLPLPLGGWGALSTHPGSPPAAGSTPRTQARGGSTGPGWGFCCATRGGRAAQWGKWSWGSWVIGFSPFHFPEPPRGLGRALCPRTGPLEEELGRAEQSTGSAQVCHLQYLLLSLTDGEIGRKQLLPSIFPFICPARHSG